MSKHVFTQLAQLQESNVRILYVSKYGKSSVSKGGEIQRKQPAVE